jgi:hypothetical protein
MIRTGIRRARPPGHEPARIGRVTRPSTADCQAVLKRQDEASLAESTEWLCAFISPLNRSSPLRTSAPSWPFGEMVDGVCGSLG